MIEEEGMDLSELRETMLRLLPILLIGTLITANMMLIATQVVPQWQLFAAVQEDVNAAEAQLVAASSAEGDDTVFLLSQVENANTDFLVAVQTLLTRTQPEEILERLYAYAGTSGVTITGVLTQQSALDIETDLYALRMFRVHVLGNVPRLMNFVMRIEEARIPSVQINNLTISENEDTFDLTMDILLYHSEFADGNALANVPLVTIPEPFDPPLPPTPEPITETADLSGGAPPDQYQASALPGTANNNESIPDDLIGPVTYDPTSTPTDSEITEDEVCSAPVTTFQIGQTVVVDFNGEGALNLLEEPRTHSGPIELLGVVQNDDRLRIISGPVCGQWQGTDVWYWLIDFNGLQGWVGEASAGDRWLCTLEEPECT